jgi:general secretion pathway protein A
MEAGYESFIGLIERPFSLTSDPKYFFKSRSHGRVMKTLTNALRADHRFLVVIGDLGIGKTVLSRTLVDELRPRMRVALVRNPLIAAETFERVLVDDLGLPAPAALDTFTEPALIIVDEAHTLPPTVIDQILAFARRQDADRYLFRFVFIGQTMSGDPTRLGIPDIDDRINTRVRLQPLDRDECAEYVEHRLHVAGPEHTVRFTPAAHEYVFALSGGVPRLINLLCERALQEAARLRSRKIERATIDAAADGPHLLRARPRRFRWFDKRVS